MLTSVIIPTFRRPATLRVCLDALAPQRGPAGGWEVVIVDNEPPPGSEAVVAAWSDRMEVPCRYVRESEPGAGAARNRGITEARGDVIAMLDDDVLPADGWLERLVEPIAAGRCEGTGGRVVLDPSVHRPSWFDDGRIGGYLTHHDPADHERAIKPGEWLVTANAAFRADLLRSTGGFIDGLGPKGRGHLVNDDVLLARRFREAGGRLHHVPDAVVIHELPPERLEIAWILRRAYAQGRSDWILDADEMLRRRWAGFGVPFHWLRGAIRARRRDPWNRRTAAHLACDVARGAGLTREALVALTRRVSNRTREHRP